MSRLVVRAAVTVMLVSTATWMVSGPTVTATVLRAWARPTWILWPPTMMAPRTETRRVTTSGAGRRGGRAVPGRAPRSRGRASGGTGQATVRTRTPPIGAGDPSNGADDSFAVKVRRLGRSLRSRPFGMAQTPP